MAKDILCEFMEQFQRKKSEPVCILKPLAYGRADAATFTLILFPLSVTANVDLIREFPSKGALSEQGFKRRHNKGNDGME